MKIKQKTPGSNGQYYISVHTKDDWKNIFNWLIEHNYYNAHNYSEDLYPKHLVFCIDERDKTFFGTNTTCMACAVSVGHRVIEFEEFLNRRSL